jgi:primosomal protein N''
VLQCHHTAHRLARCRHGLVHAAPALEGKLLGKLFALGRSIETTMLRNTTFTNQTKSLAWTSCNMSSIYERRQSDNHSIRHRSFQYGQQTTAHTHGRHRSFQYGQQTTAHTHGRHRSFQYGRQTTAYTHGRHRSYQYGRQTTAYTHGRRKPPWQRPRTGGI